MSEDRNNGAAAPDDDDGANLDDAAADFEPDDQLEEDDSEEDEAPPEELREREPGTRRSHPGRRERAAAREIRELRERVQRAERDAQDARTFQQQAPQPDPMEQARREQLWRDQVSLLPPDQQSLAWAERTRNEVSQALVNQQSTLSDQIDRSSWDAACRQDPIRARFANQVEQTLSRMPPSAARNRETVFTFLYGQEALKQRQQHAARQRQRAGRRVAAQTTQPNSSRSDGVRQRGARGDANSGSLDERWARLRNSGRPLGNW